MLFLALTVNAYKTKMKSGLFLLFLTLIKGCWKSSIHLRWQVHLKNVTWNTNGCSGFLEDVDQGSCPLFQMALAP